MPKIDFQIDVSVYNGAVNVDDLDDRLDWQETYFEVCDVLVHKTFWCGKTLRRAMMLRWHGKRL